MALLAYSDLVTTKSFSDYVFSETAKRAVFLSSGAAFMDPALESFLRGAGESLTRRYLTAPTNASNVSTSSTSAVTPAKPGSNAQAIFRLTRNEAISEAAIVAEYVDGALDVLGDCIGEYWGQELDRLILQAMTGVYADNAAAPSGSDTHTQNDMTYDASVLNSGVFSNGVTNLTLEGLNTASALMGENADKLALAIMHPNVLARLKNLGLATSREILTARVRSDGTPVRKLEWSILNGPRVISSRLMPVTSNVYESWFFAEGSVGVGIVPGKVRPDVIGFNDDQGTGGGVATYYSRRSIAIAPVGTSYIGTSGDGGPSDANLAAAGSWSRTTNEREKVPMMRYRTREA